MYTYMHNMIQCRVLNSYSGWALCFEGFLLHSPLLVSAGALIGVSGAVLTQLMGEAMNRDVIAVILGGGGGGGGGGVGGGVKTSSSNKVVSMGSFQSIDAAGTAAALVDAKSVCIVPGYGKIIIR